MSDQSNKKLHGAAIGSLAFGAGGGASTQWSLSNLATLFPQVWAGSVAAVLVGIGALLVCLLVPRGVGRLSWKIIIAGLVLDLVLTWLFIFPLWGSADHQILSFWPYFLTTLGTFVAGTIVGAMAQRHPARHACAFASLDFVLLGLQFFHAPIPFTWTLVSRFVAGYCAAILGAILGKMGRDGWKDRQLRRDFLQKVVLAVIGGMVSGAAGLLLKEFIGTI